MLRVRNATLGLVAAVALGAIAAGPASAGAPRVTVYVTENPAGPFTTFVSPTIKKGQTKTFHFIATNNDSPAQTMAWTDDRDFESDDYKVEWYRGTKAKKSARITGHVTGGGFLWQAPASSARTFTATVKRKGGGAACLLGSAFAQPVMQSSAAFVLINGSNCLI